MRDNFEFALRQVKPGYVIALGADDGLMPHGIKGMLSALIETRQELLTWVSPIFSYAGARTQSSQLEMFRQGRTRLARSAEYLRRQATNLHYLSDFESPMFYVKGVASTTLIDRVRSRSRDGRFYHCPTPDGYSGIVLAGEVETYAISGQPFTIYGVSPTSQGMAYLQASKGAQSLSESFYRAVADTPMHTQLAGQPYSPLITLMTADYLLTAADLPGWKGPTPEIDYRQVLLKSIEELRHGLYSEGRVTRELEILDRIAEQHNLLDFYRHAVLSSRRYAPKSRLEGDAISPSKLLLEGEFCGIHDVFDAAHFAYFAHAVASRPLMARAWQTLARSVRYRLASVRLGGHFSVPSEWHGKQA
jgi:hypothetical protein